jgi:transcription antitermination protein NusB
LWRKIFKRCILSNEELLTSLEEQSIYWNDDLEIVVSFILKTIKKFDSEDGRTKPLLPMFKDDEDRMFASKLFRSAILNGAEYKALIDEHTKNWEIDRIAFMDVVIMQLALAEIQNFPTIPVNVTLNEYIEISKTYSTDRSSNFINGVLDNIVTQLKNENKLVKAKIFSLNQK